MNNFTDREIETLLGKASGRSPDVSLAYEQVQRRVRGARRRRAVAVGGACVALLGVAALTLTRPNTEHSQLGDQSSSTGGQQLRPGIDSTPSTIPASTSTSAVVSVTTTGADTSSTVDDAATSIATPPTPPTTAAVRPANPGSTTPVATSTTELSMNSGAPPTVALASTQTFVGVGGRVTVRLAGDSLTLVSFQAEAGFTAEVQHPTGSHVEVRFVSASHVTTARVDLEDGRMHNKFEESDG